MKILLAHTNHTPGNELRYHDIAAAAAGIADVRTFCVTLSPPGPSLKWPALDRLWKFRHPRLMSMYRRLVEASQDCDALICYNGTNIHPEALSTLRTFNVYCSFDDPESSRDTSEPVAAAFDAVLYGNIAARFQYEAWGCRRLAWLPIFTATSEAPPEADSDVLFKTERDLDLAFLGERVSGFRNRRLDAFCGAFPSIFTRGRGWKDGAIPPEEVGGILRRTKVGINIHNSTGPINRRMFAVAGHGAMLLSDNKTGLGQIFELHSEAIGFDTIPEAIEAARHFLAHDAERVEIARRGAERFRRDYSAPAIWRRIVGQIEEWRQEGPVTQRAVLRVPRLPSPSDVGSLAVEGVRQSASEAVKLIAPAVKSLTDAAKTRKARLDESYYVGEAVAAYHENAELKGVNMAAVRVQQGEPLEWPNIVALNWAVTSLVRDARHIVEIGAGTGAFARYACVDSKRRIDCFELDDFARKLAQECCTAANVHFYKDYSGNLKDRYELLVSVEVIEHVDDVGDYLEFCARLAPRAIFTTPNRVVVRGQRDIGPPMYPPHVREFNAGEMYVLLKAFYSEVRLYHMPDVYVPWLEPMTVADVGTPIVAECLSPRPRFQSGK